MSVKNFSGKLYLDSNNIDGSGGTHIPGIEDRSAIFDTGMDLVARHEDDRYEVDRLPMRPPVLSIPLHDFGADAVKMMLRPFTADGIDIGPRSLANLETMPRIKLLIVPLAVGGEFFYAPYAQLAPESQWLLTWHPQTPMLSSEAKFICSRPANASLDEWKASTGAIVKAYYSLGGSVPT